MGNRGKEGVIGEKQGKVGVIGGKQEQSVLLVGNRSKVGMIGGKQEQGGRDWWERGARRA